MDTIVGSHHIEVKISVEAPFVIIGEGVNPTGRKRLATALSEGQYDHVLSLVKKQVDTGADIIDVNVGIPGLDETKVLPQVTKLISEEFDAPICLDSANADALAAALAILPGKPLVNSVNGEEQSLAKILPIVKDRGAAVIGLTMDGNGISQDPESRLSIAGRIIDRAAKLGIPIEDIVVDPLVLTVGTDSKAGLVTLQTIELLRKEFGVNVTLGASNVSFGLPDRHTINQAFLVLAIGAGANCAITDPVKLSMTLRAVDLLRGRDTNASRYIKHFRRLSATVGAGM